MRGYFIGLLVITVVVLAGGRPAGEQVQAFARQTAAIPDSTLVPDFSLPDSSGRMVCFSRYSGKVILLDFWASWCGPCRRAFEGLRQLQSQVNDTNFVIISISVDPVRREWLTALRQEQLPWPQLQDHRKQFNIAGLFDVESLPTTFLIDRQGRLRYKDLGGVVRRNVIKAWLQ